MRQAGRGVVGAGVGGSSANDCDRYGSDYRYDSRYDDRYRYGDRYSYGDDRYRYDDRYRDDRYRDDRYYSDDRSRSSSYSYGSRYESGYSTDRYGCRTVETRAYTREGRLVTRYEQSCPDRY